MGGLSTHPPGPGDTTCDSWPEAAHAARQYLNALGIMDEAALAAILSHLEPVARQKATVDTARRPAHIIGEVLITALLEWFRRILQPETQETDAELLQRGRMALLMVDLSEDKQRLVLQPLAPEHPFAVELKRLHDLSGPQARFAEMRPEPLDLGALPRLADSALSELDRAPRLRFALLWLAAIAFFGTLFLMTR